jgi:murein L,D-transpeptidase YcbB/YkuD
LQKALATYRDIEIAGGWTTIPDGPVLKPGMVDARVALLRERLARTGDLSPKARGDGEVFNDELVVAVKRFQRRHGLDVDGVAGPATLSALNVPVSRRIRQIVVNLERWRWLPQALGEYHVIVNIADFHLDCVEKGDTVHAGRVIVGRDYRRTPVFSDELSYIVFNPNWEVPNLIAVEDILPIVRKDPSYLERMGFDVLRGWGADEKRYDAASIDWKAVTKDNFPYRLRQKPGTTNALGRMKLMFPNRFSVYLHDTPARELFGKTERTFSSGCIRVERPIELATWLLSGDAAFDERGIRALLESGETRTVRLPRRVPIHLLYWTSWVDATGTVYFRRDIYGRDARLDAALRQDPPGPGEVTN